MIDFGEKIEGVDYHELPCARAVIHNKKEEFAFVALGTEEYFLLGGGMEKGETPQQTIMRECIEEAGAKVIVGRKIGTAADYLFAKKEQAYFHKVVEYFEARIEAFVRVELEPDHKLVWSTLEEARPYIRQKSQGWAVEQVVK